MVMYLDIGSNPNWRRFTAHRSPQIEKYKKANISDRKRDKKIFYRKRIFQLDFKLLKIFKRQ